MKKLSLIISVYNEEAVLEKFYKAFCSIEQNLEYGGGGYELIFVNDGILKQEKEKWYKYVR